MTDVVERYLLLGLRLGRHVDGLVDAYYGPVELARGVDAEAVVEPQGLVAEADALAADLELSDLEPQRRNGSATRSAASAPTQGCWPGSGISYCGRGGAVLRRQARRVSEDTYRDVHVAPRRAPPGQRVAPRALRGLAQRPAGSLRADDPGADGVGRSCCGREPCAARPSRRRGPRRRAGRRRTWWAFNYYDRPVAPAGSS